MLTATVGPIACKSVFACTSVAAWCIATRSVRMTIVFHVTFYNVVTGQSIPCVSGVTPARVRAFGVGTHCATMARSEFDALVNIFKKKRN